MNINKIKNMIVSMKDSKIKIKVNMGRNKHEYYEGKINNIHPNLFTVITNCGIKSFTYTDVLTKSVTITKF